MYFVRNSDRGKLTVSTLALVAAALILYSLPVNCFGLTTTQLSAISELKDKYPGVMTVAADSQVTTIYGVAFGTGADSLATCDSFIVDCSPIFGVASSELTLDSMEGSSSGVMPMKYDQQTGLYAFSLAFFKQSKEGLPVFEAQLGLLVKNDSANSLVLATSSLKDLSADTLDPVAVAADEVQVESTFVDPDFPNPTYSSPAEKIVWAGKPGEHLAPKVAVEFTRHNGEEGDTAYLYVIDILTSDILLKENMIDSLGITGDVSGLATEGIKSEFCEDESSVPLPYLQVTTEDFDTTFTDATGSFSFPDVGVDPITVTSKLLGQYFQVEDQFGSGPALSSIVTPPGPVSFIHNAANTSESERAAVNAYLHANKLRDLVVKYVPLYLNVAFKTDFKIKVMQGPGVCKASYNRPGEFIRFSKSQNNCHNYAFSSIIHHEYGHHIVRWGGGIGGTGYVEGMADAMGILITDDPRLAVGHFGSSCTNAIRTGNNTLQWPYSSANNKHERGQLLSGCIWSLRNELQVTNPSTYLNILSDLTINSILFRRNDISRDITIDFLTYDDDDGNIYNGTPHFDEIVSAFGAHNMTVVHRVPEDYSTIQAAIDASSDGHIVAVQPGTYNEIIRFNGKAITVISSDGPKVTKINGSQFWDNEDENSVLEGFKVDGGTDIAVECRNAGPTIKRCLLVNQGLYPGEGAISLFGDVYGTQGTSPAKIINCTIAGCTQNGIMDKSIAPPEIRNCIIFDNDGAGIEWNTNELKSYEHPILDYNDFYGNGTNYVGPFTDVGDTIFTDPKLWGNWTLKAFSPCIDTGDPGPQFNDPDGSRNDLGAMPFEQPQFPEFKSIPETQKPNTFALSQNYPNPFNPVTKLSLTLAEKSDWKIEIYNIMGQKVESLTGVGEVGTVIVEWDATRYASGIYLYKATAGTFSQTRKMTLLK